MFIKRNRVVRQPKYSVNLVFHNGTTRIIIGKQQLPAAEIMFEFPDMMICPANSFFINRPVPFLSIHEYLVAGQTYLVLPLNCFSSSSSGYLSISSIAALASTHNKAINFTEKSFQFVKGSNGRALIKVSPEFLTGVLVTGRKLVEGEKSGEEFLGVCSTPELKKHYEQLVGTAKQRNHFWSPKLETISESEYKNRVRLFSCPILGFMEWKKQGELLKNLYKFNHLLRSKELHRIELSPRLY